ncbi:hypothetical protein BS47DRAFT_1310416 [Hydnum rufescens UP504]|uniref:Uncharacterized protein n=1 Tax=Hydnum rufescens UP504 TaxID=1448309 RepID=A0A9P6DFR8_9AGAM|nr:hypothetical protein BS47DRAFT_1310416 [Hydnum rufescens UP504]
MCPGETRSNQGDENRRSSRRRGTNLPSGTIIPDKHEAWSENGDQNGQKTAIADDTAYSFTDYRAQGQTISFVLVDLAQPPSGRLTPFNTYVALSRSSGRDTIRLIQDFDNSLFTTPACEVLEAED